MENKQPFQKRKIVWVAAIIAVAAVYQIAHPYLERQFDVQLPSLIEDDVATVDTPGRQWEESDWEIPDADDQQPPLGESTSGVARSDEGSVPAAVAQGNGGQPPFLVPTGKKNRLQSPAGLIYGQSRGEHRVDHVMRHAVDDPSRPVHSVFEGDRDQILRLIDEAYDLIKSKSKRVRQTPDKERHYRTKYTVDMQRKIGYLGGRQGKRQNFPPRNKLTLVLDNEKFMVTAYPDR